SRFATTGIPFLGLMGHTSAVTSAAFSPDGSRIVTGSRDQTAKVWDATTGTGLVTFRGTAMTSPVWFSRDGLRLIGHWWDQTAKVSDAMTGAEITTLETGRMT